MARYVTSGAQYNPFDFNAMWKSAEAATQAHYAQGAQFASMAEQMSPYEALKYNPDKYEIYYLILHAPILNKILLLRRRSLL